MPLLQRKEIGTTVDFTKGIEITNFQRYMYRDDVVGILAYQSIPATINATIRDAFLNGNLADVQTQAAGQGMLVRYVETSWNETAQGNNYLITDFVVGVVFQVTRDYNTGPAYMVDALKAIPWFNQFMSKTSLPWKGWQLLSPTRAGSYNHWVEESVSDFIVAGSPINEPPPELPDAVIVKAQIMSQGNFQNAFGTFTTNMLEKGYSVTFPANSYGIDICYEKTVTGAIPGQPYYHGYYYKVHVRFWWDFTTVPDFTTTQGAKLQFLTTAFILWLIIIIGGLMIVGVAVYNLTHTRSEYTKWGPLLDANGNPILDSNGNPIIIPVQTGSQEGPPDWWGFVVPIIALIGAGAAVYVILKIIPRKE
jgi:hypothetical protein